MKVMMMDETEEWIQRYIQKQIEGMVFRSEEERQHRIQQARQSAEAYLQAYQGQAQGNLGMHRERARRAWEKRASGIQGREICGTCGGPLSYSDSTEEWYCPKCAFGQAAKRGNPQQPKHYPKLVTGALTNAMSSFGQSLSKGDPQERPLGLWQAAGGSENPQVSQKVGNYLRNLGYIVRVYKKELGPPGLEYDYWFVDFDVSAMSHGERTRKGTEFWQKHDQIIKRMFAEDR